MTEDPARRTHDLNHALTAALGALDSALGRAGLDAPIGADLRTAHAATRMAIRLLVGDAPRPEILSLAEFMRETLAIFGNPDRVNAALIDATILADRPRLERVLLNLAANAWEAMANHGTLTVRTGTTAGFATITLSDEGPGIMPDESDTPARPGRGHGLAIVRDLLREMGGFLTLNSRPGTGVTVTVHLPLVRPEPAVNRLALLVEDEAVVRHLAERALRQAGWQVMAVASSEAALPLACSARPDIVVTDVTLPGLDGRALITALRAIWPTLPAILVSGYPDSTASDDPAARNTVFLAKPYALSALIGTAARLVHH